MIRIISLLSIVLLCLGQYMIWFYAPVEQTMGLVQKIFYMHLPMAWWSMISFFVVFVCSALYLIKRSAKYDRLAGAAAEIGVVLAALALITGSVWGRASWNVWWTWDPRLTTTLIMWFVYAAYLVLRSSPMNPERRSMVCSVLGVIAFLDVPLVFYSARMWRSIHPAVLQKGGGMEPEMWHAVIANLVAFGALWVVMLMLRSKNIRASEAIEAKLAFDE